MKTENFGQVSDQEVIDLVDRAQEFGRITDPEPATRI
jgi:hypothetical protein